MRIGLELSATQNESRHRGIGRYVRGLIGALRGLAAERGHELVYYVDPEMPTDRVPEGLLAVSRALSSGPDGSGGLATLVGENRDGLDWLLLTDPVDLRPGFAPPILPVGGRREPRLRLAAISYDLIPLLYQDAYFDGEWPEDYARRYLTNLERVRAYDRLLAISEATRRDLIDRLAVGPDRVDTIGAAGDACEFDADGEPGPAVTVKQARAAVGLDAASPYLLSVGLSDWRKNFSGLVAAFAELPTELRDRYKLVLAGVIAPELLDASRELAERRGIGSALILTGRIDDAHLNALYRGCSAFVFPSLYEGFGLPILEAMQHGVPVVAGRNSSQIEVAGDAAVLVDVSDPAALAEGIARVLLEPDLAARLRAAGPVRAAGFSWTRVANRLLDSLEQAAAPSPVVVRESMRTRATSGRMPRVAMMAPLPPSSTAVAVHSEKLIEALADVAQLDVYHEALPIPNLRFRSREMMIGCHDHRLFHRVDRHRPYRTVIYQIPEDQTNDDFIRASLRNRPGIVVLRDATLRQLRRGRATTEGAGVRSEAVTGRSILERAEAILVHTHEGGSLWSDPVRFPRDRTVLLSYGVTPAAWPSSPMTRAAARRRVGLPVDHFVVGYFGDTSRAGPVIEAFAAAEPIHPRATLLVVGPEAGEAGARRSAGALGLGDRVRFGKVATDGGCPDLIAASDVGIVLGDETTPGPTWDWILSLWSQGVAVVTTCLPIAPDAFDAVQSLTRADRESLRFVIQGLAGDPFERERLGEAGWRQADEHHSWSRIAMIYREVIDSLTQRWEQASCLRGPHRPRPSREERGAVGRREGQGIPAGGGW